MAKVKKKLNAALARARKEAKAERQKKYMWVLMKGWSPRASCPLVTLVHPCTSQVRGVSRMRKLSTSCNLCLMKMADAPKSRPA